MRCVIYGTELIWHLHQSPVLVYSKTCLKRPLKRRPKLVFKTDYRLMQVKSIAECSKGSILKYFLPSLSYHLPLRPLFCVFLSDPLRQFFGAVNSSLVQSLLPKDTLLRTYLLYWVQALFDPSGLTSEYAQSGQKSVITAIVFGVSTGC